MPENVIPKKNKGSGSSSHKVEVTSPHQQPPKAIDTLCIITGGRRTAAHWRIGTEARKVLVSKSQEFADKLQTKWLPC